MKAQTRGNIAITNEHEGVFGSMSPFGEVLAHKISVVIPVYNEERTLKALFAHLNRFLFHEIILVDGGSTDRTAARSQDWAADQSRNCRRRSLMRSEARGVR